MRRQTSAIPLFLPLGLALAACGGGGGGGGGDPEPTVGPNESPVLTAPGELNGGPVLFSYTLPMASTASLTFNAADSDGDALLWQVAVSGAGASSAGLAFASPAFGTTFTIDLGAVSAPTTADVSVLVEDTRGAAAAIDILLIRSGAPTLTSVSRTSAFASAPQSVTITGSAFSLGNSVTTLASFGGVVAENVELQDENTLTCTTPQNGIVGPNAVGISNTFGSAQLPPSTFTMYEYPLNLFAADTASDAGAGAQQAVANEAGVMHTAWLEAGGLQYRHSEDAGATWSTPIPLDGLETPSNPQVAVDGQEVTVVWVGDGQMILARSSDDGGATFGNVAVLNPVPGGVSVVQPRVVTNGGRKYCTWLQGSPGLGQQRVRVSSSAGGEVWRADVAVSDDGANQFNPTVVCAGDIAWVAYYGAPAATGPGVYTSRTNDTGVTWSPAARRSQVGSGITAICGCNDGTTSSLAWVRNGELEFMVSNNLGLGWPTQSTLFRSNDLGAITAPVISCEGDRLFAAYVAGGQNVAVSRVGAAGAAPEHVTVSDVVEECRGPQLAVHGNYVYVAYSSGAIGGGTGTARIRYATSVDIGLNFTAPIGLGDGTAAQDQVRLMSDEARVWLGWLDYRGANAALFENRTEQ